MTTKITLRYHIPHCALVKQIYILESPLLQIYRIFIKLFYVGVHVHKKYFTEFLGICGHMLTSGI